jgi:hypothetical protein
MSRQISPPRKSADAIRVATKWCLSFFNRQWKLEDYPIHFRHYDNSNFEGPERQRPADWLAQVIRWPGLAGVGRTREEALETLHNIFDNFVDSGGTLPRPGTAKKLEWASREKLEKFSDIEQQFVSDILGLDWALMTDESSLWDFHAEESNDTYYFKIRDRY